MQKEAIDPALAAMLLGGGVGGIAGGVLEGQRKGYEGETRGQRLRRILKNALLFGTGGAAAGGLGGLAYNSLATAQPKGRTDPSSLATGTLVRGGTALGIGAGMFRQRRKGEREAGQEILQKYLDGAPKNGKGNTTVLSGLGMKHSNNEKRKLLERMYAQKLADKGTLSKDLEFNSTGIDKAFGVDDMVERSSIKEQDFKKRQLNRLLGKGMKAKALSSGALAAGLFAPELLGLGAKGIRAGANLVTNE